MNEHIHDCTGPDMTCPCGFKFTVPPVWVSIEIGRRKENLIIGNYILDSLV